MAREAHLGVSYSVRSCSVKLCTKVRLETIVVGGRSSRDRFFSPAYLIIKDWCRQKFNGI